MNAEQKAEALRLAKWIERALYGEASLDEPADKAAALLRTLAAEPQSEPVAWLYTKASTNQFACVVRRMDPNLDGAKEWLETPLFAHPPKGTT